LERPPPVIVKLGGSVLTRKRRVEALRPKVLHRLAAELAASTAPVIVLHGAGSFGHPGAQRFGLAKPPEPGRSPEERRRGAAIVSAEVRRLHLEVLRALVAAGDRPWSVPAATVAANRAGRLDALDLTPFRSSLSAEMRPVSFGDVVPDTEWAHSILSADAIAVELVRRLGVRRVLFLSDVEGIYDPAPSAKRKVVEEVSEGLVARLKPESSGPDVTGGIRGKAESMLAISALGADAGLISGLKDGSLSRALRGERVFGSRTTPTPR